MGCGALSWSPMAYSSQDLSTSWVGPPLFLCACLLCGLSNALTLLQSSWFLSAAPNVKSTI